MNELTGWGKGTSPYHRGEQELQSRLGLREHQEMVAKRIHRPYMPDQHREFFAQLPLFIVGSVDAGGAPWASVMFGRPGFISSPNDRKLKVDTAPVSGDPLIDNITLGAPIGLLGIEMQTRRRNRLNGVISSSNSDSFELDVVQSYGNCPQYIQTRAMEFSRDPQEVLDPTHDSTIEAFDTLDEPAIKVIRSADTFFVASHNHEDDKFDTGGVDASHRGGQPGFVKVEGNTLTIPDYVGNFAFNTLGNFLVNPKAGLLFIDFDTGDLLQLTGTVEILWDAPPEVKAFRGAERAWRFTLERGVRLKGASPLRWSFDSYSPNTLLTGNWDQADSAFAIEEAREAWREYRVVRVVDETESIRSFYLEPSDQSALFDYQPGQFLPLRFNVDGHDKPLIRTYTLSSGTSDRLYRISVKRESSNTNPDGVVSNFLHDQLKPGDVVEAKAPRGSFIFDTQSNKPAVLISGGVGVTPMISMARARLTDKVKYRHARPLIIIQVTRTEADRAFDSEFKEIEQLSSDVTQYYSVVTQAEQDSSDDSDFQGHLSVQMIQRMLPFNDYEFFLCGPDGFMQSTYDLLTQLGVDNSRILAESFGPSALKRKLEKKTVHQELDEADSAVVEFTSSKFEQAWSPDDGTLLEFAENHGLSPNYACRNGVCGTCAVKVDGPVSYRVTPTFETTEGEVLICCAAPAKRSEATSVKIEL